ncbi:MAG: YfhO family protein [Candidatus Omnitrophota bacterium]|jgi:hypothetical protein
MKKAQWITLGIFSTMAFIYTFPVFKNISYWGHMDWDQFTFWHAVPREVIVRYKQFPLWNPYANGGNVLLAHPQSAFLSPFFIFVLLWGPIMGLKLEIFAHLVLGLTGMYTLSRHMGLNRRCSYFTSCVYMLCSIFPLHLGEGQVEWLALSFVPWIFIFYLKTIAPEGPIIQNPPFIATKPLTAAIVTLGLILVTGVYVINLFLVFLFVYAVLKSFQVRQLQPLSALGMVFIGACLLGAVKVLPMLEFVRQVPRLIDQKSGVALSTLWTMLFSRGQAFLDTRLWETVLLDNGTYRYGWHEYGAYIGFLPFFLFIIGGIKQFKNHWPLLGTAVICLLLVLGDSSPINLWRILHGLPVYGSLTVPSRFMFCVMFPIALLSGFGLSHIEHRSRAYGRTLSLLILLFVTFDLWQVNSVLLKNVFCIPPQQVVREPIFRQRYSAINFYKEKELSRSSQYPILLSNSGILDAYECSAIRRGDVRTISDQRYRGEFYFKNEGGKIVNVLFSPNKVVVTVEVTSADTLVINQNYYTGWRVKSNGKTIRPAVYKGLLATRLGPGRQKVIFYYLPLSFMLGLCLSLSFILLLVVPVLPGGVHSSFRKMLSKGRPTPEHGGQEAG